MDSITDQGYRKRRFGKGRFLCSGLNLVVLETSWNMKGDSTFK